jgi:MoxR-like ATPase
MIGDVPYRPFTGRNAKTYVFQPEIIDLINLAIFLGRPILVEGEAGCGKTTLARAVAEDLGLEETFVSIPVKSTSQAKDLFYRFDGLRRLQDAQNPKNERAQHVFPYISLQPLGDIIRAGQPCVALIDEVDKADIDFPNDILDVLDKFEFVIEDLPQEEEALSLAREGGFGRRVKAEGQSLPIIIITSNQEKPLPEPFLRRCLYLQLSFPKDPKILIDIATRNLTDRVEQLLPDLIQRAVNRFLAVREQAERATVHKLPATSELVDWVHALHWRQRVPQLLGSMVATPDDHLKSTDMRILFKNRDDIERFQRTEDQ